MDLAKDLACCQKIFRGRSTDLKIEKSGFFRCIFATLTPYFISFLDTQWAYKIITENINIKRSPNRLKKNCFCSPIFLPSISSLTRKFRFFLSDNKLRERSNKQWTRSSLSDQNERNFRVRLEIKGKKNRRKKTIFFLAVERRLNIFCQAKSFARSIILPKRTKFSGETKN